MTDDAGPDLYGRPLRYYLSLAIWHAHEPLTIRHLVATLERDLLTIPGRPSKTVLDALRYEIAHRRVRRIGRSQYARDHIPESTVRFMGHRLESHLEHARQRAA